MKIHRSAISQRRRAARGFSLVEIVLVLAIIALLLGVAVKGLSGIMATGQDVKAQADIDGLKSALTAYQIKAQRYPTTEQGLRALVERPSTAPVPRQWIKQMDVVPLDPWQNEYYYYFPGKKNGVGKFDIGSRGPDGIEGTDDDIGNWQ